MIQAREENRAPEESRAPGESRATALNLSAAAGDYGQRWQQAAGDLPRPRHLSPAAYSLGGKFLNRELSWLEFNRRVLQEARNRNNPFMERLNFLSITQSNLDEFYMVRVASLKDQVSAGYDKADLAGLLPQQQLTAISEQAHSMLSKMFSTYNRSLEPALRKNGIYILQPEELSPAQAEEVLLYFRETVYPILTPMAVDSARPFPLIYNRSLNLCFLLQNENQESNFVTVQVPSVIPRCHRIQAQPAKELAEAARAAGREAVCYILLEDIIRWQIDSLCRGQEIQAIACYRIMRNADMDIDEEEAADLLTEIEKQIRLRDWGAVIHLETATGIDSRLLSFLVDSLKVDRQDIYLINGPLDLTFLSQLYQQPPIRALTALYYPPYEGQASDMLEGNRRALADDGQTDPDIFALIARQDILLHHPYEAFDPVLNFLKQAAEDPDVLAIKMTLYRVSGHSRIIDYLERAAQNSKQVLVLVELKARFDEEKNIHWARRLEKAGCHVLYGIVGLKTHSKITLVVRREADGIHRYLHLGTGNYNDSTARLYTDLGLFLSGESYGSDATEFFNMLSGFAEPDNWNHLIPAPYLLRKTFRELIAREIRFAQMGKRAAITAKMNSLVDETIIDDLYRASQAGVEIDLIVRGICCLRPGVPGLSDHIRVRSIVGRFLEHSRIYCFANDGQEELYLASADWMPRNLDRRIELMFPVEDRRCRERVKEVLELELEDNQRAHIEQADGTYKRASSRGHRLLDSQARLCELACERAPHQPTVLETHRLTPAGPEPSFAGPSPQPDDRAGADAL